ncbi:RES family NAD+ phosphorylase [Stenotrophomonas terrae]|uniref:RES family NAD+ phosphorylase n=1 Tax=Stenotrophomonas terrae TaxID=405446 RepID=UPI00320AA5DD
MEIESNSAMVDCTECSKKRKGISINDLGRRLEGILRRYYVVGEETKHFAGVDDDRGSWQQLGDDLSDIVQDVLGECYNCHSSIVEAVKEAEDCDPQSGDYGYWCDGTNYQFRFIQYEPSAFPGWHETKAELKHGRRFFSPVAASMFAALFEGIDDITARVDGNQGPVCYSLPLDAQLFRSRVVDSESMQLAVTAAPARQVGPPPPELARSGRMNAEGVSVLYASNEAKTCVSEMRPAIGSTLAVVELRTTRKLRVLDLRRLEKAWAKHSLFDPKYSEKRIRFAALRQLHEQVSQPILPGRESDYIVTQTMAEYLAHVCDKPFDGIVFRSAQDAQGTNIVLFARGKPFDGKLSSKFGVKYKKDSLSFVRIRSVKIESESLSIVKLQGHSYLLDAKGRAEFNEL